MIVKSCRRKDLSFSQLFRYLTDHGRGVGEPFFHNFPAAGCADLNATVRAFLENARHLPRRKNGNVLYQEILSLHAADATPVTPAILRDLAARYLERRAPGAMAYATVHLDGKHPHIHLVIAANLCGQSKKLRLSRSEFAAVKLDLEYYQRMRYPELVRSCNNHGHQGRDSAAGHTVPEEGTAPAPAAELPPGGVRAAERARRLSGEGSEAPSHRELLHRELLRALTCAASWEEFRRRLQASGISVYHRGGRPYGIIRDGRQYRFKTLGVADAFAAAEAQWQQLPARRQALAQDRLNRTRRLIRSFGYAQDLLELIEGEPADPAHRTLRQDRRERRRWQRERDFHSLSRDGPAPDRSP